MLLQVNQHGVVLSVNKCTGQPVFGLEPSELVGRPLAAFVNVFAQWRQKYGEDVSLLAMLCMKAAEFPGSVVVRVGLHCPVEDDKVVQSADTANRHEVCTDVMPQVWLQLCQQQAMKDC
eukprot:GHUV01037053.1.p1 GENE.GHUV01037053.1~~GHUV01037053.1.p1  ORF type:complete len:119 (-),score=22.09 GHUV01037053.1:80-436(-)